MDNLNGALEYIVEPSSISSPTSLVNLARGTVGSSISSEHHIESIKPGANILVWIQNDYIVF